MPKPRISFGLITLVLAIALIGGILGGGLAVSLLGIQKTMMTGKKTTHIVEKQVYVEESKIIDTVKEVSPAVVSIVISKDLPLYHKRILTLEDPFSTFQYDRDERGNILRKRQKLGGGSGFIVTADGLVLSNRHVLDDREASYTIILNDGTEYNAEIVSADNINDVAVLRMKDENGNPVDSMPVVKLGNSDNIQVGQHVITIGNALAEYENTVTTGVISARGRSITAGSIRSAEDLMNLIQTDAVINPGNSGGPLVSLNGEVIGINTAIATYAEGIAFAIPINDVKSIIESIKIHGKIVRPYLGVRFMMLDQEKANELGIDVKGGALLVGNESKGELAVVPSSPADKAGLQIKDIILEADGEKLTLKNPLHMVVSKKQSGDTITLKIWRNGEEMEIKVTLAEAE